MQLVSARCPDCGADLKIPEGSLNVTCEYCGSNVLVSEILGSNSVIQNCMTLAYAALQNNNYKEAYNHFDSALEQDMRNYSAWFGKALCAGELSTVAQPRFDEMMNMFETALSNAPADKQVNIKKNAAAEVVKAVRNTAANRRFAEDMLGMMSDDDSIKSTKDMAANLQKAKFQITKALQKAQEYDPSNQDIPALINEVNAVAQHIEALPGINQQIQENFSQAETALKSLETQQPAPAGPVYGKKKGGCGIAIAALLLVIGLSLVIYFVASKKDDSGTKNKSTPMYYSSYTYSVVKESETDGKLYVALFTDAVDDSNLIKINTETIRKYSSRETPMTFNYYSSKDMAEKYGAIQTSHDKSWILKNASSINLKATFEYDLSDKGVSFYRYVNGKTREIDETDKSLKPKPPK